MDFVFQMWRFLDVRRKFWILPIIFFTARGNVPDAGTALKKGATITVAGQAAANVHGTVAGVHDLPGGSTFIADYTAEFQKAPGAYSAIAYACAQVIIANAAKAISAGTTDLAALREAVRAAAVAADNKYDTVIGPVTFDKNGDPTSPTMAIFQTKGTDWSFVKQFGVGG